MKIQDVITTLEKFAPLPLQESYDNAGLQVGLTKTDISGVLLCLDVTEEVLTESLSLGCNLVIAHHPLIFNPLKRISDETMVERCVRKAIAHNITIYAAHTNLDNANEGVNFKIAQKLGLESVQLLSRRNVQINENGRTYLMAAGAGAIGSLPLEEDSADFLLRTKDIFHVHTLQHNELLGRAIKRVAICGGAGDFLLKQAINEGADAFITGEMHYHQYFYYDGRIQIAVLGHYQSEQFTVEIFYTVINDIFPELPLFISSVNTNPIKYL